MCTVFGKQTSGHRHLHRTGDTFIRFCSITIRLSYTHRSFIPTSPHFHLDRKYLEWPNLLSVHLNQHMLWQRCFNYCSPPKRFTIRYILVISPQLSVCTMYMNIVFLPSALLPIEINGGVCRCWYFDNLTYNLRLLPSSRHR